MKQEQLKDQRGEGINRAEAELLTGKNSEYSKYRDKVETGSVECVVKGCTNIPNTVCESCVGYVCKQHTWRHPDCSQGR